jgi:hypothetical protein
MASTNVNLSEMCDFSAQTAIIRSQIIRHFQIRPEEAPEISTFFLEIERHLQKIS